MFDISFLRAMPVLVVTLEYSPIPTPLVLWRHSISIHVSNHQIAVPIPGEEEYCLQKSPIPSGLLISKIGNLI